MKSLIQSALSKSTRYLILLCLLGHVTPSVAQDNVKPDPNFHIYLLMGQSNMSGRGVISPEYQAISDAKVMMLDSKNNWVPAKHPVHFEKPKVVGVGPGLAFGIEMAKANPSVKIGLVPCAVGGTPIEVWQPGAQDSTTRKFPYDDALLRIKEAMKTGIIKGVVWHQGEANSSIEKSQKYLPQLQALIERVRKETKNKNLPFVVGELGRYRDRYAIINEKLAQLPGLVKHTAVASSEGLMHKGDGTHLDSPSATTLGKRMAEKMLGL